MTSTSNARPGLKNLVLLGAGHAHVLHSLAKNRPADLGITVIAPYPRQLYSGMVPGFVAGQWPASLDSPAVCSYGRYSCITPYLVS